MHKIDPINVVLKYIERHGKIMNRDCRQLLDTSYDETIYFLGGMCKIGLLTRQGASSGTHYVLSGAPVSSAVIAKFKEESTKRLL